MDEDDGDDARVLGIGFASGIQQAPEPEHSHEFKQVQPYRVYRKKGLLGIGFVSIFCDCGAVAELPVEDTRGLSKESRKELGI